MEVNDLLAVLQASGVTSNLKLQLVDQKEVILCMSELSSVTSDQYFFLSFFLLSPKLMFSGFNHVSLQYPGMYGR